MFQTIYTYLTDTSGVTGIEYGFIIACVSGAMITGAFLFGDSLSELLQVFEMPTADQIGAPT